jgi:hypothetical protein
MLKKIKHYVEQQYPHRLWALVVFRYDEDLADIEKTVRFGIHYYVLKGEHGWNLIVHSSSSLNNASDCENQKSLFVGNQLTSTLRKAAEGLCFCCYNKSY